MHRKERKWREISQDGLPSIPLQAEKPNHSGPCEHCETATTGGILTNETQGPLSVTRLINIK